jgi:cysteine synthase B
MYETFYDAIKRYPILDLIWNTSLVRIDLFRDEFPDVEVYAKTEMFNPGGSIKDRSVLRMLTEAIVSGALSSGKTILDSTSGNARIAYTMIGRVLGYPVDLVIPGRCQFGTEKTDQCPRSPHHLYRSIRRV